MTLSPTNTRNEADTRAELIDPALRDAGWGCIGDTGLESRIVREYPITAGRLTGNGRRQKADKADYVLIYRGQNLAVVEAKRADFSAAEGVAQAKRYAEKLCLRFAYATNGHSLYEIDMHTGKEGNISTFPTPQELWARCFEQDSPQQTDWRTRFSLVPYEDKGGTWQARYYQDIAIRRVLDAIAAGQKRILLTLATGTGKTFIAFQIAWKLFQSRWNLSDNVSSERPHHPPRTPRILFLADRNILADQAYNAFSPFGEDARVRINPERIKKTGTVPFNGSVFFTIFQTFMSGADNTEHEEEISSSNTPPDTAETQPHFYGYAPDFFDVIIIDECHRGGARDHSTWRGILEYFSPAVQIGLTATPKRQDNADTYAYFGEPVYVYSLRDGINDGYLTPYRVVQMASTLDEYVYTPDDIVLEGNIEQGRRYTEPDFNREIIIEARERARVKEFMRKANPHEKTLVFCQDQKHAALVRDLMNQEKTNPNPFYCVRVTAADGAEGERWLRQFQDNEKTIPTILTTSQKLSTGVDARNVRNIVLLRPVGSMIEFKQIVGRGTRLYEGKDYFTIYDFVKAHYHFNDPEWDGEPLPPDSPNTPDPTKPTDKPTPTDPKNPTDPTEPEDPKEPRQRLIIQLADGKERSIQFISATMFYSPEGRPLSAQEFIERLYGELPRLFKDEDELRRLWGNPETREKLLDTLETSGFGREELKKIRAMVANDKSDLFDVLAYIAFARPIITREERTKERQKEILAACDEKLRCFIEFILGQYVKGDIEELNGNQLPNLLSLYGGSPRDAIAQLGTDATHIKEAFTRSQQLLFEKRSFV